MSPDLKWEAFPLKNIDIHCLFCVHQLIDTLPNNLFFWYRFSRWRNSYSYKMLATIIESDGEILVLILLNERQYEDSGEERRTSLKEQFLEAFEWYQR